MEQEQRVGQRAGQSRARQGTGQQVSKAAENDARWGTAEEAVWAC